MQPTTTSIKDLMTAETIAVRPETPLLEAVDILLKHGFSGVPVADETGKVVGILTDYDLTLKGSSLHLPTFIKLLREFSIYKKDRGAIRGDVEKILAMRVRDAMNPEPLLLPDTASVEEAVRAFSEHHRVNPIPIVDGAGKLVGILSRYDLIKLFGAPSVDFHDRGDERTIDRNVSRFLDDFERQFVLVSKFRTRYWLILSAAFAIVGFIIAFALILRIK